MSVLDDVTADRGPGAKFSSIARVGRASLRTARRDPKLAIATVVFTLLILSATLGPLLWRVDPLATNLLDSLQPPSASHPMGTDSSGRDLFARFNRGAQISLGVAVFIVTASALIGVTLGLVAGTLRGVIDIVVMRIMDALLAFPPLILAMAVTVGLGSGISTAAIGIAIPYVPRYALLVRSSVLRVRALPMVEATVVLGASKRRTMFRHILPQTTPTILVESAIVFGYATVALASLGFVGLGAQPPTPEWGSMITDGLQYALTGEWWPAFFPGVAVLLVVTGASLLADSLQARLDPRGPRGRG